MSPDRRDTPSPGRRGAALPGHVGGLLPGGGDRTTLATALFGAARLMQFGLVALLAYYLLLLDVGIVVNVVIALAIALVPDALRAWRGYQPNPVLTALLALSPFLHAIGMLGYYRSVPVFDQIAHAVTALLLAGAGYVVVQVADDQYEGVEIPREFRMLFVLLFVTAIGVLWEVFEFGTGLLAVALGGEPLLEQYGASDVVLDLLFDGVGALLVALWGTSYFDGVRSRVERHVDGT